MCSLNNARSGATQHTFSDCTGVMIKIKMTANFKSDLVTFAPPFVHSVC